MLPKVIFFISVPQAIAAQSSEVSLSKVFSHKKRSLAQFTAYVQYLKQMARQQGISETTTTRDFDNIVLFGELWQQIVDSRKSVLTSIEKIIYKKFYHHSVLAWQYSNIIITSINWI